MKLLYATSITYPSSLANRLQTMSMARAFHARLDSQFTLGVRGRGGFEDSFMDVIPGSGRSYILAWRYAHLIRTQEYTHVFCREYRLLFFLMLYLKLMRQRPMVIFEAHTMERNKIFRFVIRHVDAIIATADGVRRDLASLVPPKNILVAHAGVDFARFVRVPDRVGVRLRFGIDSDVPVVLYSGSFGFMPPWDYNPWKGADVLLESVKFASQEYRFVFVGGETDEIRALRERYPDPRILFLGSQRHEDIPTILSMADVLVLPNRAGEIISERYTSPLKLTEYMASGVPIVASDLPSIREVADEYSVYFVQPNNPQLLAAAIEYTLTHSAEASERAAYAREEARRHTWDARAEDILAFVHNSQER